MARGQLIGHVDQQPLIRFGERLRRADTCPAKRREQQSIGPLMHLARRLIGGDDHQHGHAGLALGGKLDVSAMSLVHRQIVGDPSRHAGAVIVPAVDEPGV